MKPIPKCRGLWAIAGERYGGFHLQRRFQAIPNEYFARKSSLFFVCQTTFQKNVWEKCAESQKKCVQTQKSLIQYVMLHPLRQQEAARLAEKSDVMIVIGGSHSSNTAKLAAICRPFCRTVQIETASQLDPADFVGARSIAITAGASTPARIIKEVHETMSEILENQNQEDLASKRCLISLLKVHTTVRRLPGVVTSIAPNEIAVDIGTKHAGYVPLSELTDDPAAKPEDIVHKGDELELLVVRGQRC